MIDTQKQAIESLGGVLSEARLEEQRAKEAFLAARRKRRGVKRALSTRIEYVKKFQDRQTLVVQALEIRKREVLREQEACKSSLSLLKDMEVLAETGRVNVQSVLGRDGQVPADVMRLRGHVEGLQGRVNKAIEVWVEKCRDAEAAEAESKKDQEEEEMETDGPVRPLAQIPVGAGLFARTLHEAVRTMRRAWVGGLPVDLNKELTALEDILVPLLEIIRPHEATVIASEHMTEMVPRRLTPSGDGGEHTNSGSGDDEDGDGN